MPQKRKSTSKILPIRDADGTLHAQAAQISKWLNGATDYSGAVRYSLGFVASYIRTEKAPLNYQDCTLDQLQMLTVHGYDFTIRAAALAEIERRYQGTRVTT